jgi:hypothetical protein
VLKWILLPAIGQIISLYLAGTGNILVYFWFLPVVGYVYWKAKPRVEVHGGKALSPERLAMLIEEQREVRRKREKD